MLVCAATVLAVVVPQAANASTPVIVGGSDADQDYPFMVSIQRNDEHYCGGALVHPEWVLTAAHCVHAVAPRHLVLRHGSPTWREGGEQASVAEIIGHPDFDWESPGGDIALVKLTEPAQSAPIELGADTEVGTRSRLLGWGQTCPDPGCGPPSDTLKQLDAEVIDPAECADIDAETELCTGNSDEDSGVCYGDSGGPQIIRHGEGWQLIGITSRPGYAEPTCAKGPSIYTNAVAYTDWITENTGGTADLAP